MTEYEIRFLGDPVGYRMEIDNAWQMILERGTWHEARVGITDRRVDIDLAKAYLIEKVARAHTPAPEAAS